MSKNIPVHGNLNLGAGTVVSQDGIKIKGIDVLAPVSGQNIKTINGQSILGSGDIVISGGSGGNTYKPSQTRNFSTISKYFMDTTPGQTSQCMSSATVFSDLEWSRVGASLTIKHTAHGRSAGDRVIIRNTNVDTLVVLIDSVTADTFTVTCADNGVTEGTFGAYSCGLKYAHDAAQGSITAGAFTAPANSDVLLMSFRTHLKSNSRSVTNYVVTIPTELIERDGNNTIDSCYVPIQQIRQDADTLIAVANAIYTNINGSYASFRLTALPALTTGIIILLQF